MTAEQHPTCKTCARYAGMTNHKRHGTMCVNCRTSLDNTTMRPHRSCKAKNPLPCKDYHPKTNHPTMVIA